MSKRIQRSNTLPSQNHSWKSENLSAKKNDADSERHFSIENCGDSTQLTEVASYLRSSDRRGIAINPNPQEDESRNAFNEVEHKMTECGKFFSMTPVERKFYAEQLRIWFLLSATGKRYLSSNWCQICS